MALPNLVNIADEKALGEAASRVFAPFLEEIKNTIKEVRSISKQPTEEFNSDAFLYSIRKIEEAAAKMSKKGPGERGPDNVEMLKLITNFRKEDRKMQEHIIKRLLQDEDISRKFSEGLVQSVDSSFKSIMGAAEPNPIKSNTGEQVVEDLKKKNLSDKNKDSRDETRKKEDSVVKKSKKDDKDQGVLAKLLDFLTKNDKNTFLAAITQGIAKLAFGVGAIGLVSMLPKQVREFVGQFTATLQFMKNVVNGEFLLKIAGMFKNIPIIGKIASIIPEFFGSVLKVFSHLPIIGAILRKVPILNWIFAAFDILPKMLEKYKSGGIWAALQEGLQGVYRFFVRDVLELVGKFANWIEKKLFNTDIIDFSAVFKAFSDQVLNGIGDIVRIVKALFKLDFKEAWAGVKSLASDIFHMIVDPIKALFKNIDVSSLAVEALKWMKDTFMYILEAFKKAIPSAADIGKWATEGLTSLKDYIVGNEPITTPAPPVIVQGIRVGNEPITTPASADYQGLRAKATPKDAELLRESITRYVNKIPSGGRAPTSFTAGSKVSIDNSSRNNQTNMTVVGAPKVTSSGPLSTSNGRYGGGW